MTATEIRHIAVQKGFNYNIDNQIILLKLCQIQQWLRQEHHIHIEITGIHSYSPFCYTVHILNISNGSSMYLAPNFKTYEKALEAALFNAMTKILKIK